MAIWVALAIVAMLIVTLGWLSSRFSPEDLYGILD